MLKLLFKLAIAGLVVNIAWTLGAAYAAHYRFRDSVRQEAMIRGQSETELHQRVLEIAAAHEVPLASDGFTIRSQFRQTFVQGAYEKWVPLLPGYEYPLHFTWAIDAYLVERPK